ncbi:hypothetical protein BDA96_10G035000 [Sorghum bicolor]|nr:hypothetical protein BDA96_10G035000 [Sorghum bicolor]
MASQVVGRRSCSQLPSPVAGLLLVTIVISFTAVVADSARVSAPPPTTAAKPIEVYAACSKTIMPKRCSVKLSNFAKTLAETKAIIAGPELAAAKLKSDSCITECAKVVDEATSKAAAAKADEEALNVLNGYLNEKVMYSEGPIGPCECNCPEPCSADESAAVKKLGEATGSMRVLVYQLRELIDSGGDLDSEEKKAEAAEMEKSMDSGVLHVTCGLTKQPQKCSDELSALAKTTDEAKNAVWYPQHESVVKPPPALESVINDCRTAIEAVNQEIYSAESQLKNLAEIRAAIHSYVQGDGKKPQLCKYSCPPPPPEKPCTANETVIVDKLSGVYDAWVAADKFLTELLPPAEVKGKDKASKKTEK